MDAIDAILSRRSVSKVEERFVDRATIERIIEAATRAPNHFLTQPWRFIVLTGDALDELGEAMAERVRIAHADDPDLSHRLDVERSRPRRAPVIVTVVYRPSTNPRATEVEDRYAVGAAMENALLAAHSLGLGAYLRTGPAALDPVVHRFLELVEGEEIAGFIYVGYPAPDEQAHLSERHPVAEVTTWRGWNT